jgi:hypothetical protein
MLETDIYDLKYCNESCMNFNVEGDLDKITAKVLIISCKQDPHFPPELDGIPMSEMIENSKTIVKSLEYRFSSTILAVITQNRFKIRLEITNDVPSCIDLLLSLQ